MLNYTFHWNQAFKALPQMLDGAVVTLQIALLSMVDRAGSRCPHLWHFACPA
jgi:hypothetical protein